MSGHHDDEGTTGGSSMSDINVTPLVDVMLVLLIIFMVTAPMLGQSEIELPAEQAEPLKMDEDQIILQIDRAERFWIRPSGSDDATEYPFEEVPVKLAAMAKANPDLPVFVEADGEVPYAKVAFVLAAAQAAGMPRVGMVFDPTSADDEDE